MTVNKPTLVSLFSGAGGLDAGLEIAGFSTVFSTDTDRDCIETLQRAKAAKMLIPSRPDKSFLEYASLVHADVADIDPRDIRPAGAATDWQPDLLAGGPPCQPFSSAGKMLSVDDRRGRLFEEFVRLADGLKPKLILFENVRGMVTARGPQGRPGEILSLVRDAFERIGYATTFALLNAANFGVPQRRVRCFMMASRRQPLPRFPVPTHAEQPGLTLFDSLQPWVTLGEFLATQPPASPNDIVRTTTELGVQLALLAEGTGLKSAGARETTRPGGHWGYRQGTFIADPKKPARTVTAGPTQDWLRLSDGSFRRLTWQECAGLQGFPQEWPFAGSTISKYRQVGNAVPVQLGVELGNVLRDALRSEAPMHPPVSDPFPTAFVDAMAYTRREELRNGESRRSVREYLAVGDVSMSIASKGRGREVG